MNIDLSQAWTTVQGMVNGFIAMLPKIALGLILFVLFYMGGLGLRSLVQRVTDRSSRSRNLGLVLGRLAQWTIALVGVLVAASTVIPSFGAGQLIQMLGITGVAIGFAFKDIFQNFLAGILLLLTHPFQIGDEIAVHEYEGIVENIQTRATMIKTGDGRRIVIPNSNLFTDSVVVNTAFKERRTEYEIDVNRKADIDRIKARILEAVDRTDGTLEDPGPDALIVGITDSTVKIRIRWWADPYKVNTTRDHVIASIMEALDAEMEKNIENASSPVEKTEPAEGSKDHE